MSLDEDNFHKAILILSSQCDKELTEDEIGFIDNELSRFGYDKLSQALLHIARKRKSKEGFPSIAEIEAVLNPAILLTEKDYGIELASRIIGAIPKRGYTWPETCHYDGYSTFKEALIGEFGQDGYIVLERLGGWSAICKRNINETTLRSQIRDLGMAIYKQSAAGLLDAEKAELPGSMASSVKYLKSSN